MHTFNRHQHEEFKFLAEGAKALEKLGVGVYGRLGPLCNIVVDRLGDSAAHVNPRSLPPPGVPWLSLVLHNSLFNS